MRTGKISPKIVVLKVIGDTDALTTGDGKIYFTIPEALNGLNLTSIHAHVYTVSSATAPSIALYNVTDSVDMLSVNCTIDINEKDSLTATTATTIDTGNDDVATGDELRVDVDAKGTGTAGLEVRLTFQ